MQRISGMVAALVMAAMAMLWLGAARAEAQVWIQIEAKNSRAAAEDRARDWAMGLPDVSGHALASGWFAIALGPYAADEAAARLSDLRAMGRVPGDSFIADGRLYRGQFWPPAGAEVTTASPEPEAAAAPPATPQPVAPVVTSPVEAVPLAPPVETLAEARRAEAALTRQERMDIQRALQWDGVYTAGIDGAFGPGTRGAIAAWQAGQGAEATGVLLSDQRRALIDGWQADLAELGLEIVRDEEAGIEISLPLGLVVFDRYTPPFAQYAARDDSGVQVWLISQPGDQEALYGLYDMIQSLAVMPSEGPRNRHPRGFEIAGRTADVEAHAQAELTRGAIRGFLITARTADSARTTRVLQAMKSSFRPFGDRVLDPGLVPLDEATRAGLLAGVEVRRPARSASGFYADAQGHVLTAAANVEGCARITLDAGLEASVLAADTVSGLAILRPAAALSPLGHAELATRLPVPGTDVAVAGYSYGGDLPLPTMTFGRFEAAADLTGAETRARLSLPALAGDVGGPVLGADGLVIGLLQPASVDPARILPDGVFYLTPATAIATLLAERGMASTVPPAPIGLMSPEDLTATGTAMTVQVACWN
ncbi:Putative peptidoglycan binding domain-containing protein [Gemmobacter megaterium]|uniref:Putative peptidoglycan binding domain-containing protein n=1 Tax=Gemmobacter megaterium TaxID=1086013 RepID=A0A1N7LX86_9RHOB|nr:serine protease [Gemmobacter megaterium]GGE10147.1 peptidoglycan-binding protein [Gemmobacter megaterium]SIS78443.1 Putative peptidoglycan binding domain-containing protein [Gemmobacter megaterium]